MASLVFSQTTTTPPSPPTIAQTVASQVAYLTTPLDLTTDQQTQATTIFTTEQTALQALQTPMQTAQAALQTGCFPPIRAPMERAGAWRTGCGRLENRN